MKASFFVSACLAMTAIAAPCFAQSTLESVLERGVLRCGVSEGLAGFSAQDANGVWQGFDVAKCRAVAAAVIGDPSAVEFLPTDTQNRFDMLLDGDVDMLARNTTWTFSRDVGLGLSFVGVNYYDGQGFLVRRALGVSSALELDGTRICVQPDTTTQNNLADFFKANNMSYLPVPVMGPHDAQKQYLAEECDAYTTDVSGLAATRATFAEPGEHVILQELISKEPLGLVVRSDDAQWESIVRWTLFALIAAEELGVTSANVSELAQGSDTPEINRLLSVEGKYHQMLGLEAGWGMRAIAAAGNYGEIFAATIGEQTPIGLARGLNAQWTRGGLLYSPPFR